MQIAEIWRNGGVVGIACPGVDEGSVMAANFSTEQFHTENSFMQVRPLKQLLRHIIREAPGCWVGKNSPEIHGQAKPTLQAA